ncbi:MAG: DUF1559 domain-containing protein [Thermoguttaceae bacterium]|jgi:type II secretory pathway pseudopilin PulG
MEAVVSGGAPKGPLWERLKKAEVDNDIIVSIEPDACLDLGKIIDAAKIGAPPLVANYLEAVKTLRGGTATFNLTAPSLVHVVLDTKDAEAAGSVEELLQQTLRMASGGLASIPKEARTTSGPLVKLANELVTGVKTTKAGSQVTLDVKRPESLDTVGASIASPLLQSAVGFRDEARRVQQINNMKQISLAMINYAEGIRGPVIADGADADVGQAFGDQTGADPERVQAARQRLERVYCEATPGSGLFFHGNLLHACDANNSPNSRWSLICCYNAARNDPYKESHQPRYTPLKKVPDAAIKEVGAKVSSTEKTFLDPVADKS